MKTIPPFSSDADHEARITSWLMGELSPEDAHAFEVELNNNPDLAIECERFRQTIHLLRSYSHPAIDQSNSKPPVPANEPPPIQLSHSRREALLAHFKTVSIQSEPHARNLSSTRLFQLSPRIKKAISMGAAIAASFVAIAFLLTQAQRRSNSFAARSSAPMVPKFQNDDFAERLIESDQATNSVRNLEENLQNLSRFGLIRDSNLSAFRNQTPLATADRPASESNWAYIQSDPVTTFNRSVSDKEVANLSDLPVENSPTTAAANQIYLPPRQTEAELFAKKDSSILRDKSNAETQVVPGQLVSYYNKLPAPPSQPEDRSRGERRLAERYSDSSINNAPVMAGKPVTRQAEAKLEETPLSFDVQAGQASGIERVEKIEPSRSLTRGFALGLGTQRGLASDAPVDNYHLDFKPTSILAQQVGIQTESALSAAPKAPGVAGGDSATNGRNLVAAQNIEQPLNRYTLPQLAERSGFGGGSGGQTLGEVRAELKQLGEADGVRLFSSSEVEPQRQASSRQSSVEAHRGANGAITSPTSTVDPLGGAAAQFAEPLNRMSYGGEVRRKSNLSEISREGLEQEEVTKLHTQLRLSGRLEQELEGGTKQESDKLSLEKSKKLSLVRSQEPIRPILLLAKAESENPPADTRPANPVSHAPQANPEISTADNPFSTFSLNVSDVSFKLTQGNLNAGKWPETSSIRLEEFVNAFDYRDPAASIESPVAFHWERARYPFVQDRDVVRFSIKTAAIGREAGRPMNLVLLLDNSGSMERGDRVAIIQGAMQTLSSLLRPQDKVSVVAFARTARLWADGLTGGQISSLVSKINELTPDGGTNLEEALALAYQTAVRHFQQTGNNRVVLLTDGAANLGETSAESLADRVEYHRKKGIALDCFGIGWDGLNDLLLERLARNGDGRYGFVNSPEEATEGFVRQLAGALQVAASDVKVQVKFNPERVTQWQQLGYTQHRLKQEDFRNNSVDAAELGGAESGNAMYLVQVKSDGIGPIGTVHVRYKEPHNGLYKEHSWVAQYDGPAPALENSSASLKLATTSAAFSSWLLTRGQSGEITLLKLQALIHGVPQHFAPDIRPTELERMIQQARSISGN